MTDNSPTTISAKPRSVAFKALVGTAMALILAAAGVVVPIVWDIYKSSTSVAFTLVSADTIIENQSGIQDLQLSYKGRNIAVLSRVVLRFENDGRTPVTWAEVVSGPAVKVDGVVRILEASILGVSPADLVVTIQQSDPDTVKPRFDLLNPGDHATILMLVEGKVKSISASGRIRNVPAIKVFAGNETARPRDATFYIVVIFTSFSFLFSFGAVLSLKSCIRIQSEFTEKLSRFSSIQGYERLIETVFNDDLPSSKAKARRYVKRIIENPDAVSDAEHNLIASESLKWTTKSPFVYSGIVMFLIGAIGLAYVTYRYF